LPAGTRAQVARRWRSLRARLAHRPARIETVRRRRTSRRTAGPVAPAARLSLAAVGRCSARPSPPHTAGCHHRESAGTARGRAEPARSPERGPSSPSHSPARAPAGAPAGAPAPRLDLRASAGRSCRPPNPASRRLDRAAHLALWQPGSYRGGDQLAEVISPGLKRLARGPVGRPVTVALRLFGQPPSQPAHVCPGLRRSHPPGRSRWVKQTSHCGPVDPPRAGPPLDQLIPARVGLARWYEHVAAHGFQFKRPVATNRTAALITTGEPDV